MERIVSENKWLSLLYPRLALALLRGGMVLFSAGVILATVVGVSVLVGIYGLLMIGKDDFTISNDIIAIWPQDYPLDLLYEFAWGYLAVAAALLLVVLPFALAVLEKFTLLMSPHKVTGKRDTEDTPQTA